MVPKNERLEIRLDGETIERVDGWRIQQRDNPSRSEAVRRLIEIGLDQGATNNFSPGKSDKLITWMLSEVLKNQLKAPDDWQRKHLLESVELIQEAMVGGHFWALDWEMPGVMHSHVDSRENVKAVMDILDMWSFIETAYTTFTDEEKKRLETELGPFGKNPQFMGFDGNNETEHLSIARFLVEKMGRFERLKNRDFNSHMPTVDRYRRMAEIFEPMRATLIGRELSASQVIQLLKRG